MSGVVVLNASYEPLGVVPIRRAIKYITKDRAQMVEAVEGEFIQTANDIFPVPLVVQFKEYIKVPYRNRELSWSRRKMLERDSYTCAYCGKHGTTVDHIIPQSRGGKSTWMNTITACLKCNGKKDNKMLENSGLTLMFQPRPVYFQDSLLTAVRATGVDMVTLGLS